ncbi:MAG: tetratricopeptide repeat protein [Deltaproteobacteria bacterium]|nr:tetratricopeptide repeat protein [Deltaproteobacteria bacterium]
MERKLTAILSADVKDYSRLMGDNEEATIRTLTAYREVMTALIQQHRGRVVDSPGDNLLAEFASAVDAVQGAVEIQCELQSRNVELPDERKMHYRIGINVGDVIVEGERLYGDGVNIAARLEGLAEPGGICISGTVYDQVENKLALGYEYVGEQAVKNITKPVRVYQVREEESSSQEAESQKAKGKNQKAKMENKGGRAHRPHAILVAMGVLVAGGIAAFLLFLSLRTQDSGLSTPPASLSPQDSALRTDAAPAALPLPDKPSIAVLPFTNMSGDPEQEYFSDGMTDTLITDLSKLSGLFVIARNSTFTYKGHAVDSGEVSRKLGVRYIVEGSVQKVGDRVRINTQLIDATTGGHVWAERYDRALTDIFRVQDELTQEIVSAIEIKLTAEEQARVEHRYTDNLDAYDAYLRGEVYRQRGTQEANVQARQLFEQAITLDPKFAEAYIGLSLTYWIEWISQWSLAPATQGRALELAQQALALDNSSPLVHQVLGILYLWNRQHEQALAAVERALALAPNYADAYVTRANILSMSGRADEAPAWIAKAMRLNPNYHVGYLLILGQAYYLTGQYETARTTLKNSLTRNPDYLPAHRLLAAVYSEEGQEAEARAEAAEVLRLSPTFSLEVHGQRLPYKDPAVSERFLAALRKAGLK